MFRNKFNKVLSVAKNINVLVLDAVIGVSAGLHRDEKTIILSHLFS